MESNNYITATRQRRININLVFVGFFLGAFLTGFTFVGLSSVKAKTDYISQVRSAQSTIYDTATRSQNEMREVIKQLEYLKSITHENARIIDSEGK